MWQDNQVYGSGNNMTKSEREKIEEMEHLPRKGNFEIANSDYDGVCPRCFMTEEEASQKPCFNPGWVQEQIYEAKEEAYEKGNREGYEHGRTRQFEQGSPQLAQAKRDAKREILLWLKENASGGGDWRRKIEIKLKELSDD